MRCASGVDLVIIDDDLANIVIGCNIPFGISNMLTAKSIKAIVRSADYP
ncbi:MAG: hypothetical protein ACJA0G_001564 [Kangiellaceae bacterium]|jgi:hypothetical protein